MPLTDGEQVFQAAERIRDAIASHPFARRETQPGGVLSISGGVAVYPADGDNSTELIRHADQALYKAKATGRNRIVVDRGFEFGESSADVRKPRAAEATLKRTGR
jgi:two-component system cell cycle response regulator